MRYQEYDYHHLSMIRHILKYGVQSDDRTGVGTRKVFGTSFKVDVSDGYLPLFRGRFISARIAFEELMWMLRGQTDVGILQEKKIHIWDGNSSAEYLKSYGKDHIEPNTIGKGYGHQFRNFNGVDQLEDVVSGIQNNPNGRRHVISLWNPADFDDMSLHPCFVAGTNIMLGDGTYTDIKTVNEGDLVMSDKGVPRKILTKFVTPYQGEMRRIKVSDRPHIFCTKNHPFYVKGKGYIDAKDIVSGDFVRDFSNSEKTGGTIPEFVVEKVTRVHGQEINRIDEVYKLSRNEDWYLLGYFLGNGYTNSNYDSKTKHTGTISIPVDKESEILNKIGGVINLCPKYGEREWTERMHTYTFSSKKWAEIFRNFGHGAYNKKIADFVFSAPLWAKKKFIEGYIDADGCNATEDFIFITTVSPSIAFGIEKLCSGIGTNVMLSKQNRNKTNIIEGRTVNQKDTYNIRVRRTELKRRKLSNVDDGEHVWLRVVRNDAMDTSDIKNYDGNVYNIEVEEDNTYVVEGIHTHNCHFLYEFMVTGNTLNIHQHLRSADVILGNPTNIVFATMFLGLVAKLCKLGVGTVWQTATDAHIYENHVQPINDLLNVIEGRETEWLGIVNQKPTWKINKDFDTLEGMLSVEWEDVVVENYHYLTKYGRKEFPMAV